MPIGPNGAAAKDVAERCNLGGVLLIAVVLVRNGLRRCAGLTAPQLTPEALARQFVLTCACSVPPGHSRAGCDGPWRHPCLSQPRRFKQW